MTMTMTMTMYIYGTVTIYMKIDMGILAWTQTDKDVNTDSTQTWKGQSSEISIRVFDLYG
jgi:hypothetical protein